jgi:DNA-binding transcriptional regulator GbsR (MarR family)
MDELSNQIENLKTNEDELEQTLNDYDLDEELEDEFEAIDAEFRELEIIYQSLLNTRRFLQDATT